MMDLSKFLLSINKHQYGVMYIKDGSVTVLDIFDTEVKASNYASYIIENIKFDGELSIFKVGEPIELEIDDELSLFNNAEPIEVVDEMLDLTSADIKEQCQSYFESKLEVVNVRKSNDKSKIKPVSKKLTLRKKNKRTKIQIRFSSKGNK